MTLPPDFLRPSDRFSLPQHPSIQDAIYRFLEPKDELAAIVAATGASTINDMYQMFMSYGDSQRAISSQDRRLRGRLDKFLGETTQEQISLTYDVFNQAYRGFADAGAGSGVTYAVVGDYKRAFVALINKTDAQWLQAFFKKHPEIVDPIGGIPGWVSTPQASGK